MMMLQRTILSIPQFMLAILLLRQELSCDLIIILFDLYVVGMMPFYYGLSLLSFEKRRLNCSEHTLACLSDYDYISYTMSHCIPLLGLPYYY